MIEDLFENSFTSSNNLFEVRIIPLNSSEESEDSSDNLSFRIQNFPSLSITPKFQDISFRDFSIQKPDPIINDPKRINGVRVRLDDNFQLYNSLKDYLVHSSQGLTRSLYNTQLLEDYKIASGDVKLFNMELHALSPVYTSIDDNQSMDVSYSSSYVWEFFNCHLVKISPITFQYGSVEPVEISLDIIYTYSREYSIQKENSTSS